MEDRPIKIHVDEVMREHIEYVLNRYLHDCERLKLKQKHAIESNEHQMKLTRLCIDELRQAGT